MNPLQIAIPLHGKMVYRSLHTRALEETCQARGLNPVYYVEKDLLPPNSAAYAELALASYQKQLKHPYLQFSNYLRWFMVPTQSTDTRFRNMISDSAWTSEHLNQTLLKALGLNLLRKARWLAPLLIWGEERIGVPASHQASWQEREIRAVLVSGVGNHDFEISALFAREARQQKLPVFANITNYDNLLSKGYRGFTPTRLAVWSQKMAAQAEKLLGVEKQRLVVTGPTVFDRYFQPLQSSREAFLTSRGLNPKQKTLFYAGHTSVVTYFDFLGLLLKLRQPGGLLENVNLIIRPYPHTKVNQWAGIKIFRETLAALPNVYLSDPFAASADNLSSLNHDTGAADEDELHGILKYSDVMVNYFSTLGLEAAICDLPTIHIAYDPFTFQISPMAWASTGALNTHNQDTLRRAAAKVVKSDAELVQALESYLENRNLDQAARREYALSECGYLDGQATARLAGMLADNLAGG